LRDSADWNGVAWTASFATPAGGREAKIRLPFSAFAPTQFARTLPNSPPLRTASILALQLSLSKFEYDGGLNPTYKDGPFALTLVEVEGNGCALGPNAFKVSDLVRGKTIAIFGLPGAFTPTCSAKHVPSYLQHFDALKAKGVDEIWCVSVNDAFVMGAWGRDQKSGGKVRMMADGSAEFARATGLMLDLTARGMGVRSDRYSMLVVDGVVKQLNHEAPGKFEVSDGATLLGQL
jgi:peroxiredoxin